MRDFSQFGQDLPAKLAASEARGTLKLPRLNLSAVGFACGEVVAGDSGGLL